MFDIIPHKSHKLIPPTTKAHTSPTFKKSQQDFKIFLSKSHPLRNSSIKDFFSSTLGAFLATFFLVAFLTVFFLVLLIVTYLGMIYSDGVDVGIKTAPPESPVLVRSQSHRDTTSITNINDNIKGWSLLSFLPLTSHSVPGL